MIVVNRQDYKMKQLYAKGKRGLVYTADYKGKKIAIKIKNPKSTAIARIEIEAKFLKKLNKHGIGPKFIFFKNNQLGMEFIHGELFQDYIQKNDKKKIIKVIRDIFEQLYTMDKLGINKEEMHHPVKHIIINKNKPYLIDFERCHYSQKPKNVTQFVQYIARLSELLKEKGIFIDKEKISRAARDYKREYSLA